VWIENFVCHEDMYIYVTPGKHFIFTLLEMHALGLNVDLSGIVRDFYAQGQGFNPSSKK
jgi:hypothetical protein